MDPTQSNQQDQINQNQTVVQHTNTQQVNPQISPSQSNPQPQTSKISKRTIFIFLSVIIIALFAMIGYIGVNYLNTHETSAQVVTKSLPFLSYFLKPGVSSPEPQMNNPVIHVATPTTIPTRTVESNAPIDCGSTSHIVKFSESPGPIDNALTCFINAAKTCSSAKIKMILTADINGQTTTIKYYQIQSGTNGSCILNQKQGATTHIYPSSVPLSEQQTINQSLNNLIGLEGNCQFNSGAKIALAFANWGEEGITSGNNPDIGATCSGPIFESH